MIIYQVLPRLWGNGRLSAFDAKTFAYLKDLGVTHVWYTGLLRHATGKDFVKGSAGSPYAISDYYDVNPYLADNPEARMEEFDALVARTHRAGLKFLMDFVPNHVARDYDRSALPLCDWWDFDWTDTLKIDYQAPGAWEKMLGIVRFWASRGVDGFRCDMVELVPADFLAWLIRTVKAEFPEVVFIAEVYHKESYRQYVCEVGFDYLYDKSGLYDVLRAIVEKNVRDPRGEAGEWQSARSITWNWQFLGDIQSHMLNFLENHDEQRFPCPEFGASVANEYAPLAVSALFNTAPFMVYFGQEIGVDAAESPNGRTTIFDFADIEPLGRLYGYIHGTASLRPEENDFLARFWEVMALAASPLKTRGLVYDLCYCNQQTPGFDPDRHFAFLRCEGGRCVLFFCNFSDRDASLRIQVPQHAFDVLGIKKAAPEDGFPVSGCAKDFAHLEI
jgi:glycosidase